MYDTVTVKGWSVDVRTHRIGEVISKVLMDPWPVDDRDGDGKSVTARNKSGDVEGEEGSGGVWADWWGWKRRGPRPGDRPDDDDDDGNDGGEDDKEKWDKHGGVPKVMSEDDCVDCYKWYVSLSETRQLAMWYSQGQADA